MNALDQLDKKPLKSKKFCFALLALLAMGTIGGAGLFAAVLRPSVDLVALAAFVSAPLANIMLLASAYIGATSWQEKHVRSAAAD